MSKTENHLDISLPSDYKEKNVLLKIEDKKVPQSKVEKFRSFCFTIYGAQIIITHKTAGQVYIKVKHLYEILWKHGLSKTLPMTVTLNPTKFVDVDWSPLSYGGPNVWYFTWKGTQCSIAGRDNSKLWIRVHDLTVGLGEKIMDEIAAELSTFYVQPPPQIKSTQLTIYTCIKTPITASQFTFQWSGNCNRLPRHINTIYIDTKIKNTLTTQLTNFYASKEIYDNFEVLWKRIHLFHGPPGSGKTSTVIALASMFGKNIAKLTITPDLDSQSLETLFRTLPHNTILLMEDVDALFVERKSITSVDFSTLLNCMDGVTTQTGIVIFMTTNHKIKLDDAFVRPGRVDVTLEFHLPGKEELRQALKTLAPNFASEHEKYLQTLPNTTTIASLQHHIFNCILEERKTIL